MARAGTCMAGEGLWQLVRCYWVLRGCEMRVHGSETCIILIDGSRIKKKSRIGPFTIYTGSRLSPLCSGLGGADLIMLAKCVGRDLGESSNPFVADRLMKNAGTRLHCLCYLGMRLLYPHPRICCLFGPFEVKQRCIGNDYGYYLACETPNARAGVVMSGLPLQERQLLMYTGVTEFL